MRRALTIILASFFAIPLPAQQIKSTSQTIQMECRDLASSGDYIAPNETVIDGKACHPVFTPAKVAEPVATESRATDAPPVTAPAKDALAPKGIVLEDGTPVHLVLSENLSSASAVTGQTVEFEVVDDIVVDNLVVVPHGSTAWATVTEAEHKRRLGRGGKLDLNIDKVRLADGEKALLRGVKDTQGGGHTGAMTGAIVATSLIVWPAAPFFLFMHGKDINIPKGTQITAFIQGDMRLDSSNFQKQLAVAR
ncbi:MAG: hypothetical protein ACRDHZ_04200 [Ktedonobacteraceae bacterium]